MRSVGAAVLVASRAVCVGDGHACSGGLADVERRTVATKDLSWGPFRQCGNGWRGVVAEFVGGVYDLAIGDGENAFDPADLVFGHGEVVISEHGEVGQLAWGEGTFFASFAREPTAALSVKAESFFAREAVFFRIHGSAAHGFAGYQPVERYPWIVARDAGCVGASPDRNSQFEHFSDWRRGL